MIPRTPRREFAEEIERINLCTENTDIKHLNDVKTIFARVIIFYNHLKQQKSIYYNSIKEFSRLFPDFVSWETENIKIEQEYRLNSLRQQLFRDLFKTCQKKYIDFDVNGWIDDLYRYAQILLPSFTKTTLIISLFLLMHYNQNFYISIPYLKKIYVYVLQAIQRFGQPNQMTTNTSRFEGKFYFTLYLLRLSYIPKFKF